MAGILAIWNDVAPEGYARYEGWFIREHLQERVGVPGFRFGRRYEAVSADRRMFAYYEVDSPAVLTTGDYVQRLENPTPWTREVMQSFRGMVRTVCELTATAGDLIGSHAVILRAEDSITAGPGVQALISELASGEGIARAQLWTAARQQTKADTAEMQVRGPDKLIAGAFVVECLRLADAERMAKSLTTPPPELGITGARTIGIYRLLCIYPKPASA